MSYSDTKCFLVIPRMSRRGEVYMWVLADDNMVTYKNVSDLPVGAMWEANWMGNSFGINGTDRVIVVKLPDGRDFMPGLEAANCTRRGEDHDCWCVHGEPPDIHVDKNPEPGRSTCQAGAGSIGSTWQGGWHGFITRGYLTLNR